MKEYRFYHFDGRHEELVRVVLAHNLGEANRQFERDMKISLPDPLISVWERQL